MTTFVGLNRDYSEIIYGSRRIFGFLIFCLGLCWKRSSRVSAEIILRVSFCKFKIFSRVNESLN